MIAPQRIDSIKNTIVIEAPKLYHHEAARAVPTNIGKAWGSAYPGDVFLAITAKCHKTVADTVF